jgi:single-stranded DNA-binding protein
VSVNRCTFVGRLTANPTTDILPAKGAKPAAKIARFSIAVNRYWRDAEGHKQKKVQIYLERVLFLGDGKHDTERDDED